MAFWDWLTGPSKHWYMLAIADPQRGREYRGPRYTTDNDAMDWQLNEQEWRWGATVTRYRWTGSYWARA
jgi:hypothetical protein